MTVTLAVLAVSIVFFVTGWIRSDLVALCAFMCLLLFGIIEPAEALVSFSDPVIIMLIGLFVVSGAIFRTGLAKMLSGKILKLAGTSENKLFILIMLVTTGIGMFVSNSGTVAIMLPIIISMASGANINVRKLLMPLAFAGSIGGMFTLIGTPPNLVIEKTLSQAGYTDLKFFSFAPIGCVALLVGIIGLWFLSRIFLSQKVDYENAKGSVKSVDELIKEYRLANSTSMLKVDNGSKLQGKMLKELGIPEQYDLSVLRIIRRQRSGVNLFRGADVEIMASAGTVVFDSDILEVIGAPQNVEKFAAEQKLTLLKGKDIPEESFEELGIAEVLLMPNSSLGGKLLRESGFRENYNVNILAINHHGEYKVNGLKNEVMEIGDAMLVQGTWKNLDRMDRDHANVVLVGQPLEEAAKVTLDRKAPLATSILFLMIVSMVVGLLEPVMAVLLAAIAMVLTGCLRGMQEAYKTIDWQSVVLIAAMLPMSTALQKTGVADLVSNSLTMYLGNMGPSVLLAGIYFAASTLTLFISNTATAVLFAPIAFQVATNMGVSPYPFLMAVTVAASMCFASPFSTPSNVMVMTAGRYSFLDYIKVGGPLQIGTGIIMVLVLPFIFPF